MSWDRWGVAKIKDSDPEEFILMFQDTALEHAKPFMQTRGPMSEPDLREELENMQISKADANAQIGKAREDPQG